MPEAAISDYFYGDEAEQFIYFRIPRQLITDPRFKHLSTDAKLLYGMLLDRMSLSVKNGWYDEDGRVYIYYTVEEICGDMNCGRDKAMKMLADLEIPVITASDAHDPCNVNRDLEQARARLLQFGVRCV